MPADPLELHPLTGRIGAEVAGVDLRAPVAAELAAALRRALLAHLVLVFRGQHLDRAQHKRATALFGPIQRVPYIEPLADDPDVVAVLKEADEVDVGVFGGDWHSDFSFLESPPAGSVLCAEEVPPHGGDTVWANQFVAFETLPADLKAVIESRGAVHVGKPYGVAHAPPADARAGRSMRMVRGDPAADREVVHPAARPHPETGRRALFVNPIYTTRLEGMAEAESRPVLEALYRHATRPDFTCRHRWSAGDVVVWDNRATLHYAINDYDGHRRLLYRTTFADRPA